MTDHSDLIARLRAACVGHPSASIAWPHRILHEAASALSSQSLSLSEARGGLNRFQDEVWGSFDGWSKSLGWGLTGIQPECFAMMDASVREIVEARKQLDAISAAIGSTRFMDPPDGGDVSLADQVRRMRAELEAKEARLSALENGPAGLADATNDPASPSLSSLRKGAEELRRSLICVKQQCETAVFNISQREHDEAVVRSFQSIADYCARALVSGSREDGDG